MWSLVMADLWLHVVFIGELYIQFWFQREVLSYEDEDRSDNEDEKPTIVVLKEGDLTAEEAEVALKGQKSEMNDTGKSM